MFREKDEQEQAGAAHQNFLADGGIIKRKKTIHRNSVLFSLTTVTLDGCKDELHSNTTIQCRKCRKDFLEKQRKRSQRTKEFLDLTSTMPYILLRSLLTIVSLR
jgi:hypothetical protein